MDGSALPSFAAPACTRKVVGSGLLFLLLFPLLAHASFQTLPCPSSAPRGLAAGSARTAAAESELLALADSLAAQGRHANARACCAEAFAAFQTPRALAALQAVQLSLLEGELALLLQKPKQKQKQLSAPPLQQQAQQQQVALAPAKRKQLALALGSTSFAGLWTDLMGLMTRKNIMTLPELDALRSPFDVFMMHCQFACLEEQTASAGRSMDAALALRESPQLFEMAARISLGRGRAAGSLDFVAAARLAMRSRAMPAHETVGALMLNLQAALALSTAGALSPAVALAADGSSSVAAPGGAASAVAVSAVSATAGIGNSSLELAAVWADVRVVVVRRFERLGVALPAGDPLLVASGAEHLAAVAANANVTAAAAAAALAPGQWPLFLATSGDASEAAWMRGATAAAAAAFRTEGYVVLRDLLPTAYFEALLRRHEAIFFAGLAAGDAPAIEDDVPQRRRTLWGEELSLFIGLRLLPAVSAIVGLPLVSVYTFSIAYARGGDLKPHVDRVQNAFSLSLNLGLQPAELNAEPWPLWVAPPAADGRPASEAGGRPAALAPNDALLYQGPKHTHFRRPLPQGTSMQVIFGFRDVADAHCNSQ